MKYAFELGERAAVPVAGEEMLFPLRRIYCVGRNYAEHAREMGHDPDREPPFFFTKPADAVVQNHATITYPMATKDLHYELELVAAIGKGGVHIPVERALEHVFGYGVGLDMTRRDLQGEAKKMGRPWDTGKGFDQSVPLTAIHRVTDVGHPEHNGIWLKVNGETRQSSSTDKMIWSIAEQIAFLSNYFALQPGDTILTGTPAGVGAVHPGDVLEGGVDGIDTLDIRIGEPAA